MDRDFDPPWVLIILGRVSLEGKLAKQAQGGSISIAGGG
jgi:hypothetical protein